MRGVEAERQAEAGGIDRVADLVEPVAGEAHDMQDRAEDFAVERRDRGNS